MFTDPIKNLKALGLKEDAVVADLGAGTGFYSIGLGTIVPKGKIYAVELQKDFLAMIKNKMAEAKIANIETLWGNVEKIGGTMIADSVADAVIASDILFQVEEKENFVEEVKRILKPEGQVLLVDWSESSILPTTIIISKNQAREIFEKKGFVLAREIDAGSHHYGMILVKG
jgi:ubiquinone/menaquinone biosynthesis C-methylase UbiE